MKKILMLAAAAFAGTAAVAAPEARPAEPEARLVFPSNATIRSFEAVSDDVVYIEGRKGQWYRATVFGPCRGLRFAIAIGIASRGAVNVLDRYSDLIVDGERCKVMSFVRSGPPPERKARAKRT